MLHPSYKLSEIAQAVNGTVHGDGNAQIEKLSIDSRNLDNDHNTLFFAIKSNKNDGHNYINDLANKGINSFVVEKLPGQNISANFIIVKDSVRALQDLAQWKRQKYNIQNFVITGSNGKTIVKEWLFQLLKDDYNIVRSPKSYNSQIGVPLSVWQISEDNNLGIFEAGISQKGEMENLERIIKPNFGIFTNIGSAHSENFERIEDKIDEKLKAFVNCDKIYFKNDPIISDRIDGNISLKSAIKLKWGFDADSDLRISEIKKHKGKSSIEAVFGNSHKTIEILLSDDASIENAISCWLVLLDFGLKDSEIAQRIARLGHVEMRLQQIEGENNCTIINDGYSLDLESLKIALEFQKTQFKHSSKTLIISSFEQSSLNSKAIADNISELCHRYNISKLILIGDVIVSNWNLIKHNNQYQYNSTEDFLLFLKQQNKEFFKDEVVLIKGARSFKFERIVKFLEKKSHDTVLEINLSALTRNLNYYRSKLNKKTKLMVMVKAFSYGGGSFEIANVLQYQGVDYLAVAYADEGKELREAGINLPILVLNPEKSSFSTLVEYSLEPEIYSLRLLNDFDNYLAGEEYKIHLKIDSGMHRLGFMEHELDDLIKSLKSRRNLKIQTVFSHLAAAEDLQEKDFTLQQISTFEKMCTKLKADLNIEFDMHILNSSGIDNYSNFQFDMVRLGIGLHGISNSLEASKYLEPVASLRTVISQIKSLGAGESIGYNRTYILDKEMKVATLAVGYADGIDRRWGNNVGRVFINGHFANIIGRISMDMLMVDVSQINCHEGDVVEIFGKHLTVSELASKIKTIPYEILTKISPRVKRVYLKE